MHITHIFHHYPPVIGGMENVVQNLAEEQVKLGHKVMVLTSNFGGGEGSTSEMRSGVQVQRLKSFRFRYPDLTFPLVSGREFLGGTDVVHVHSQNSLFNLMLSREAKEMEKTIVLDFLALDYLQSHSNPMIRFFGSLYQQMAQRQAVRVAGKPLTLNQRDRWILKRKYGVEAEIVPHGLDDKLLETSRGERGFRDKFGVEERNMVSYLGRLHPSKGVDLLIKAVPLIAAEVEDLRVVVAGRGHESYRGRLKEEVESLGVESRVKILGYLSEEDKIGLLDSSKLFVFPTRHFGEAYPLIVDEVYARGVPIVAARVGGLPCRVEHRKTGWLVPPEDPVSLAEAVTRLLRDDGLYRKLCQGVRDIKRSLLTWEEVSERLVEIYQATLDQAN